MNIDWSQLITRQMKDATALAELLATAKADLAKRNAGAATLIARIQDRIDTLGYGIDAGEATVKDEAEQAALAISLKAWKVYKFALGKVTAQTSWPAVPAWPAEPLVPAIAADPELRTADTI